MKKIVKELGLVFLLAVVAAWAGLVIIRLRDQPMPQSDLPEARGVGLASHFGYSHHIL